jgi:hypothetical protein
MKTEDLLLLGLFQRVALLFEGRFLNPSFDDYERSQADGWEALKLFVRGYAFEHQGRSPSFAPIAADVLDRVKDGLKLDDPNAVTEVWKQFQKQAKPGKINIGVNALAPSGTEFKRKFKKTDETRTYHTQKQSVIQFVQKLDEPNLVKWTLKAIEKTTIENARERIVGINGVDEKIASLWLRDIAFRFHCEVERKDRWMLFPVDIWVRRTAAKLSGNQAFSNPKSDEETAKWCVKECGDTLSPERLNMGFWYMGAEIGDSEYLVDWALSENRLERFNSLINDHLRRLQGALQQYNSNTQAAQN